MNDTLLDYRSERTLTSILKNYFPQLDAELILNQKIDKGILDVTFSSSEKKEYAEKDEIVHLLRRLLFFSEKAKRGGLLALDDYIAGEEDAFLKAALRVTVDGVYPEDDARFILLALITALKPQGARLFSMILMMEGILNIKNGAETESIFDSVLGEEFSPMIQAVIADIKMEEEENNAKK